MSDPNITSFTSLLKRLWPHIKPKRRVHLILVTFLTIFSSFFEALSVGFLIPFLGVLTSAERVFNTSRLQPLIKLFKISNSHELVIFITISFIFIIFISGLIRWLLLYNQTKFTNNIGADLGFSVYRATLYQPYKVHISRNSSEIIGGVSKVNFIIPFVITPIINLISSFFTIFTIIFALIFVAFKLTIILFSSFAIIYSLTLILSKKKLEQAGQSISNEMNKITKTVQEGLGGIRDVLLDGTQEVFTEIYQNADLPMRKSQSQIQILSASPHIIIQTFVICIIAIVSFFFAENGESFLKLIPILGAMALSAQRLLPAFQLSYNSWTSIKSGKAVVIDAIELLEQPVPSYLEQDNKMRLNFKNSIILNNICFSYNANLKNVLNNINLEIKKGTTVGIIGITGSGKSTLLDILMGLLSPTTGSFIIDDKLITEENNHAWQKNIAHVPQSIYLSDTTITENIAFGIPKEKIDHELVQYAAKSAQIADTIEALDLKYNTRVGERGVQLSGGQRQRIGIARALYKKADVIILDEATSALDNNTEMLVMNEILKFDSNLTIIIVAHRLTTLKNCSSILKIENGVVNNIGTYKDLENFKNNN